MRAIKKLLYSAMLLSLFGACDNEPEQTVFELSKTTLSFSPDQSSQTVTLTSNTAWEALAAESWISVTPASGDGNASVSVSVEKNVDAVRTGKVTFSAKGISIDVEVSQAVAPAQWAVLKESSGQWALGTPFIMREDGDYYAVKDVTLAAGETFTVAYDEDWLAESAKTADHILGGPGEVQANTSIPVGGDEDFVASEQGKYDLYLSKDLKTVYLMKSGENVINAHPHVTPPKVWGVTGDLKDASSDIVMVQEDKYFVAKDVAFNSISFKIRANGQWKDASNIGMSEAGVVKLHTAIPVVTGKENKAASGNDIVEIQSGASASKTYDIFLDTELMQVWIMVHGCVPGDPVPVTTTTLASWTIAPGESYTSTFGGDGVKDPSAGDGGLYADANLSGSGRITYVQVDKTEIDNSSKCKRLVASDGTLCIYGAYPGDYWLMETSVDGGFVSGDKIRVAFDYRVQSKGRAYWVAEYFDGSNWVAATTLQKETVAGIEVEFTHKFPGNAFETVDVEFTLKADVPTMKFRLRCTSDITTAGEVYANGASNFTFKLGGSPIIELTR